VWESVKQFVSGTYYPTPVAAKMIRHMECAVDISQTWILIKGLVPEILTTVIFPLLCHDEKDDEMWKDDPAEFVRTKFDCFQEGPTPPLAAAMLLAEMATKRPKQTLDTMYQFITDILQQNPKGAPASVNPTQKDGVLNMAAIIGSEFMDLERYKPILGPLIVDYVLPELASPHGFLRFTGCHVISNYAKVGFTAEVLHAIIEQILKCLQDPELPVRVQAAVALRAYLEEQELGTQAIGPHVQSIVEVLLNLLTESETEDVPYVLDKLVERFPEEIMPLVSQLTQQLVLQFSTLLDYEAEEDSHRPLTACMVLGTLHNLMEMCTDNTEMILQLEAIVLPLVDHIFQNNILDFVEEAAELFEVFSSLPQVSAAG